MFDLAPARLGTMDDMRLIVSHAMTHRIPHPMSSERTLAKVAGGRWFAKTVEVPRTDFVRFRDPRTGYLSLVGHPVAVAALKAKLHGLA